MYTFEELANEAHKICDEKVVESGVEMPLIWIRCVTAQEARDEGALDTVFKFMQARAVEAEMQLQRINPGAKINTDIGYTHMEDDSYICHVIVGILGE